LDGVASDPRTQPDERPAWGKSLKMPPFSARAGMLRGAKYPEVTPEETTCNKQAEVRRAGSRCGHKFFCGHSAGILQREEQVMPFSIVSAEERKSEGGVAAPGYGYAYRIVAAGDCSLQQC